MTNKHSSCRIQDETKWRSIRFGLDTFPCPKTTDRMLVIYIWQLNSTRLKAVFHETKLVVSVYLISFNKICISPFSVRILRYSLFKSLGLIHAVKTE